jgi:hypothetical protein
MLVVQAGHEADTLDAMAFVMAVRPAEVSAPETTKVEGKLSS